MFKEQEQLELFTSSPTAIGDQLCREIVDVVCRTYHVSTAPSLRNAVYHQCSVEFSSVTHVSTTISEYITGMATALNPFPASTVQVGSWRMDQNALSSDWQVVQRDLNQVWRAITSAQTLVEGVCDERYGQQKRHANGERSNAA
jgi:hypothetical protein